MRSMGVILAWLLVLAWGAEVAQGAGEAPEKVKVLIGFRKLPGQAEQALVRGSGGAIRHSFHIIPAMAATVPDAAIPGLRRNPMVTHVHADGRVRAVDLELSNSWGVERIGAGVIHDGGNKAAGVSVAVLDTGIDYSHPDLDANYGGGYDFVNSDADPMDDNGHGTHVAGIVAAEDNGAGVVGVAPEAKLYSLKVLDAKGDGYWSDVIAALQWSVDNGMQTVNMSLAGTGTSDAEAACQAAYDAGLVLVAAAGNSGNPPGRGDTVSDPAGYTSVIAVAATGQNDSRAKWSSTGLDLELSAPGVDVVSTYLGGGYASADGTSMASPHVAGVVALVWAAYPGLSNAQVRQQLQNTADDLGSTGWDTKYGYGIVDADEAAAPPVPTGSVAGKVTNAPEATAIAGATVSTDTGRSAVTAGDGSYVITDVPAGDRLVTASAPGFESKTELATVVENETAIIDFALTPLPTGSTVRVESITYGTEGGRNGDKHLKVTVAVVDDLGIPVSAASVSILLEDDGSSSWTFAGTTGTDGTVAFKLANAPSGCYSTTVTNVTASGLTWDGVTPDNSFCK